MDKAIEEHSDTELFYLMGEDKATADRAFEELYNRLSSRIYAYCRRFLTDKEEAKDVFQETFIRFYQSAAEQRDMTNVPAFLLKIARNLCVNCKRREKKAISFEDYMVVNFENKEENDELLNLIKRALDLLPDNYREVFVLREYDGLSYNDIADVTGASLSTIKIRLYRAKQKMRKILEPYLADISDT